VNVFVVDKGLLLALLFEGDGHVLAFNFESCFLEFQLVEFVSYM
jgi:hypothetical protein